MLRFFWMAVTVVSVIGLWVCQEAFRQQLLHHLRIAVKQIDRSCPSDWWFGR
jgi:hypothetical protein